MKYYLELTDDEVKNLAGILGSFIGKNERDKDMKEFVESARNIFEKVIHTEESCPDCFCEDCTKDCEIKKIMEIANKGLDFDKITEEVEQDIKEQSEEVTKNYEKRITELEIVNKRISTECHKLVDTLEKKQKDIVDLEKENEQLEQQIEQIQDAKCTSCTDLGGLQLKITELEKENERLKGGLELWESGGCRATNLFECGVVKELKQQIEQIKCCPNCDFVFRDGNCYYDKECKNKDHWKLRR